jgi:glycosyltransferase involved in cell wall biosynthesis
LGDNAVKVAIVHYWMVSMRGGERVTESLCRMFPDADVFTNLAVRENLSPTITRHKITETFIARLPFARRLYQKYLPLMPLALESLDLTKYDLIISNEAGPAKGIIPGPDTVHLNYCCSPMRYIWDQYHVYRARAGFFTRLFMPLFTHYLRMWDATAAMRTDHFLADSQHVANRIKKFLPAPDGERGDYYLWCGELVRYKRPDLAIEAFNASGRPLVVIGDGDQRKQLESIAKSNILFLGKAPFDVLKHHAARCRALIFPGEEDFGIVPLEVQAGNCLCQRRCFGDRC